MKYQVTERSACRVCGSDRLVRFLDLPDMPMSDDMPRPEQRGSEFLWPIRVYRCEGCGTTQTLHDVEVRDYYQEYHYSAAFSPLMQRFMKQLAQEVWQRYGFQEGEVAVEVGSGDGAQLACFQALGARVFGFEPSAPLVEASQKRGVPVVQRLFTEDAEADIPPNMLPVQVILLTYTFDHLPDPVRFLASVRKVLDPEQGVLVIEVHDLEKIIRRREFCLFEHEHATYCTAATMQALLRRAGFELINIDLVPEQQRRGNSLLVVAALQGSKLASQALPTLRDKPPLDDAKSYRAFGEEVHRSIGRFRNWVKASRRAGRRIAGYGAAGRGILTLAAVADPGDFAYVCDKNTSLHGYSTPKSHVPIVGLSRVFEEPRVDEIVVFSFGYFKEIAADLAEYTAKGGKLVSMLDLLADQAAAPRKAA
jgi:SAM-dependent methyltransferase